ncbi:hypothetical protein HMPREF1155_1197 [Slackia sp. CM382]|nr:hypothetical protein HMPREF1155_1197 [Slackia sp. CM382]
MRCNRSPAVSRFASRHRPEKCRRRFLIASRFYQHGTHAACITAKSPHAGVGTNETLPDAALVAKGPHAGG